MSTKAFTEHIIQGENVQLHYLDWGGPGQPLILIHGLGDSPYLFLELADSLKKNFRVIAYSRRGHCKSIPFDNRYDNSTLVSDLKLLIDHLHIQKANLLGWSMGGNEITEFAIQYPDKINKLIYFEAGYDLSEEPFKQMISSLPKSPFANELELSSVQSYRSWYHRFWFPDIAWNSTLESNLQASIVENPDKSIHTLPNDEASKITLQSAMNYPRKYNLVSAPSLVIFANSFFHAHDEDSVLVKSYIKLENEIIRPWRKHSMNRIKTEFRNSKVITIPKGSHVSLIFESKEEIISAINDFILI